MVHKIKLLFFIKIFTFILLTWIYQFNSELCTFNKFGDKNYNPSEKLDTGCYRILAKDKQHNDSNNVYSKEKFTNNEENNQKEIYKNEMFRKRKSIQSNRSMLNKAQYYTEVIDYNNGIFDGKHFHFQKKWIKKKNYDTFLEKKRRICNIALKKIRFRKYRYAVFMLFFFFLLGIGLPMSCKFGPPSGGAGASSR
ncbi:fam-m protein [Plasmodium malariae]|uniref:Fam-m protein n=1 Tax=Plasmodium malariae TaxID=5858 RepID=A0A1D3PB15_PLAMA|nr:fam-m protein [Plasmodium malariae]SCN12440.1 fam-m protein [Plasmodium malariae]